VHGRFSGFGAPVNWIAADILRIKGGILIEQLGCDPRRSNSRIVKERPAHVRREV